MVSCSNFYLIQGKEVVAILGASKPGPWTGEVLAKVLEWGLDNPNGTKDECMAWLKEEQAAGNIDISNTGSQRHAKGETESPPPKKIKV